MPQPGASLESAGELLARGAIPQLNLSGAQQDGQPRALASAESDKIGADGSTVWVTSLPVVESHSRMVPSAPPLATRVPRQRHGNGRYPAAMADEAPEEFACLGVPFLHRPRGAAAQHVLAVATKGGLVNQLR